MTVTITIEGNHNYCRKNDLLIEHTYECPQCSTSPINLQCEECFGTGYGTYKTYPYEIIMTNQDFSDFLATVGLTDQILYCRIWPQKLTNRLAGLVDMIHETDMEKVEEKPYAGEYQKVCTYVIEMYELCQEAIRREEMVVWQTH